MDLCLSNASTIYRDLEVKHVGKAQDGQICVFDLSTCVPLSNPSDSAESSGYSGGGSRGVASSFHGLPHDTLTSTCNSHLLEPSGPLN